MKILIAVISALIFFIPANGGGRYFQHEKIREGKELSFPVFSNTGAKAATKKINRMLQIAELELLKGYETDNIFEQVTFDDGTIYGGRFSHEFKIYSNSSKLLSLKFDESSCGATCHYWVRFYNFNSGNGDMIQLKDLFTEEGYRDFFKISTKKRIADFERELKKLAPSDQEGFIGPSGCYESDNLEDFYIAANTIYLDGENCFSKNEKFYGIDTVSKFRLIEFKSYLNSYGKSLFSISRMPIAKFRSESLPQLFEGEIGGRKISLILNRYDDEMRAEYVYLKYGKGIYLEGKSDETGFAITEKRPRKEDGESITAKFDGKNIAGTWTDKEKAVTHELSLTRK